jgi:hypothetical protein
MVTHTLLLSFPGDMTQADRDQFFREGSGLVLGSGLADSYEHARHVPLDSGASAAAAPVFATSEMVRIRCSSLGVLRNLLAYPPLGEFVRRWQGKFPYKVASANTED